MSRLILIALFFGLIIYLIKTTFNPPKSDRLPHDAFRVPGEMLNLLFSIGVFFFVLL